MEDGEYACRPSCDGNAILLYCYVLWNECEFSMLGKRLPRTIQGSDSGVKGVPSANAMTPIGRSAILNVKRKSPDSEDTSDIFTIKDTNLVQERTNKSMVGLKAATFK